MVEQTMPHDWPLTAILDPSFLRRGPSLIGKRVRIIDQSGLHYTVHQQRGNDTYIYTNLQNTMVSIEGLLSSFEWKGVGFQPVGHVDLTAVEATATLLTGDSTIRLDVTATMSVYPIPGEVADGN